MQIDSHGILPLKRYGPNANWMQFYCILRMIFKMLLKGSIVLKLFL